MADADNAKHAKPRQDNDPAKGGTTPPHKETYKSGDSPKPQGDKLQHAVDEAAQRQNKKN